MRALSMCPDHCQQYFVCDDKKGLVKKHTCRLSNRAILSVNGPPAEGAGERVAKAAEVKRQLWVGNKSSFKTETKCFKTLSNNSQTCSRWRQTKLAKLG